MKKETEATVLGRFPADYEGAVNMPVFHASTILFKTLEEFDNCESGHGLKPLVYGRSGTPATRALEEALAKLDNTDHAILTASGQSAILVVLHAFLGAGDHLLLPDSVYGSMRKYCMEELVRFGIEISYYDPLIGADIAKHIRPNTKIVYCESPGSQTFEMQDVPEIAKVAKAKGIPVVADNTWATPLYQNTRVQGVDISIHACTKYISGHADIVMGLITCTEQYFPLLRRVFRNLGVSPGSDEVYLCARGLRTLPVRLALHQSNALALAQWLSKRKQVARVLYPALPTDPGHALWKRDCTGATGLFSIELQPCSRKALGAMLDGMEHFPMGFSWGGYESLMVPFKAHRTATPHWQPKGPTLRVHAGLEHIDDLIADMEAGFARLAQAV